MLNTLISMLAALCALMYSASGLPLGPLSVPPDADTYRIEVDVTNQITTVFARADGRVVRQMICSTGLGESTPLGDFRLEPSRDNDRSEWYYIDKYKCFVKYPTRIQGPILFHSLPYNGMDMERLDVAAAAELGSRASHGCIRMNWEDARWIAENCPDGTAVRIFFGAARKDALRKVLLERAFIEDDNNNYAGFAAGVSAASQTLGLGASGEEVAALQENLVSLGLLIGPVTGVYDSETVSAVTRFQRATGRRATGSADEALRQRIASAAQSE